MESQEVDVGDGGDGDGIGTVMMEEARREVHAFKLH